MSETTTRLEPLDPRPLADRTCLVTGSSRGIGRAIALEFARCGANVAVNYRSSDAEAHEVKETIEENGETAICAQADVSKPADVERMAADIHDEFGEVDVLVNNAGITIDRKFEEMTHDDWQTVLDVNLGGTFNCTKAFFDDIRDADH
ncbi:MAG: SDR family NAD(P)-dependent oxidoreductase, partial [Haloplanus sp.]